MFQVFQAQGFRTAICGENGSYVKESDVDFIYRAGHLQAEDDDSQDEYRAFADFMQTTHFQLNHDPTPFPLEVQFPYRIVTKAEEWIRIEH